METSNWKKLWIRGQGGGPRASPYCSWPVQHWRDLIQPRLMQPTLGTSKIQTAAEWHLAPLRFGTDFKLRGGASNPDSYSHPHMHCLLNFSMNVHACVCKYIHILSLHTRIFYNLYTDEFYIAAGQWQDSTTLVNLTKAKITPYRCNLF